MTATMTMVNVFEINSDGVVKDFGKYNAEDDFFNAYENIYSYNDFIADMGYEDTAEAWYAYVNLVDAAKDKADYENYVNGVEQQVIKRNGKIFMLDFYTKD